MNHIIGRYQERKVLESVYKSQKAEFVAVYGRRRVGKTYLIRSFFKDKECVFFQTVGSFKAPINEQIARFSIEIGDAFYNGARMGIPPNWMEAFSDLNKAIKEMPQSSKVVIFLDELPWLSTPRSGVLRALDYFWNRYWSLDSRVKLFICGSSASWIINKIIKNRGGFHNRLTYRMVLKPFILTETKDYLKYLNYKCSHQQIVKLFLATGGVPYYLNNIKDYLSVDQNINQLFFNRDSLLFDEFTDIFKSLFDDSDHYKELIMLIAECRSGIARETLEERNLLTGKGGRLSKRLGDLEQAGFIASYIPFGHKTRGLFYRISDDYCSFYLKWVEPEKSNLKQNPENTYWMNIIGTPAYYNWMGYAFENLCYKHLRQIKQALGLDDHCLASPWRYSTYKGNSSPNQQGAQIDLLFDRSDEAITICEIKYSDKPYVIDKQYSANLLNKIKIFQTMTGTKKQIFLSMICSEGLKENMYSKEIIKGVATLNDLFER